MCGNARGKHFRKSTPMIVFLWSSYNYAVCDLSLRNQLSPLIFRGRDCGEAVTTWYRLTTEDNDESRLLGFPWLYSQLFPFFSLEVSARGIVSLVYLYSKIRVSL